jgi:hypothetical protein
MNEPPDGGSRDPSASPGGSDAPDPHATSGSAAQAGADVVDEPDLSVQGKVTDQEPRLRRRKRTVDQTRAGLAWALVVIFGATIGSAILVVALTGKVPAQEVTNLLKTLVPAETALLGSAVGFYFGTRKRP